MKWNYQLVVEVDDADRDVFASDARIVVAKSSRNSAPNVVWIALTPSARTVIEWEESYGLYASEIPARHGSVPRILDRVYPARGGSLYPFTGSVFEASQKTGAVPSSHYDVRNDADIALSFGLMQQAFVDGAPLISPVHGVVLPAGFTADFTPRSELELWIADGLQSGAAVGNLPPAAVRIAFNGERRARYGYDRATASFVTRTP